MADDRYTCLTCGKSYGRMYDMNIPGTDPTNPERYYLPGYLVGHRREGRRRMDVRKAVKRVLPKHKHKFESLFEFDPDVVEDDNQESDGHDSVDAEFPSRVPGY